MFAQHAGLARDPAQHADLLEKQSVGLPEDYVPALRPVLERLLPEVSCEAVI